jgi:hypothetical protein
MGWVEDLLDQEEDLVFSSTKKDAKGFLVKN